MTLKNKQNLETCLWLGALVVMTTAMVWFRTATVKHTYSFSEKDKHYRELQDRYLAARVKWLRLTSPGKLDILAARIGLKAPGLHQNLAYTKRPKN